MFSASLNDLSIQLANQKACSSQPWNQQWQPSAQMRIQFWALLPCNVVGRHYYRAGCGSLHSHHLPSSPCSSRTEGRSVMSFLEIKVPTYALQREKLSLPLSKPAMKEASITDMTEGIWTGGPGRTGTVCPLTRCMTSGTELVGDLEEKTHKNTKDDHSSGYMYIRNSCSMHHRCRRFSLTHRASPCSAPKFFAPSLDISEPAELSVGKHTKFSNLTPKLLPNWPPG